MRCSLLILVLVVVFGCLRLDLAHADGIMPFQVSVWNPIQIPPDDWTIVGVRFNAIYGRSRKMYGLDVGLMNRIAESGGGVAIGALNSTSAELSGIDGMVMHGTHVELAHDRGDHARFTGLQLGGYNYADDLRGVQVGIIANFAADMSGVQAAVGGNCTFDAEGVEVAVFVNSSLGDMTGVQLAGINSCKGTMRGVQVGILNYAKDLHGVQIGLANIVRESPLPFFPLINAKF